MSRVWCTRALFFLMLSFMAATAYAATGSTGQGVQAQQHKQAVLERVRPRAKQGIASAQYNLGVIYDRGYGVERNYDKARKWYKKAAAQAYGKAAHNLGVMYQLGHGVPVNHEKAAHWFKKAAKLGEPASENNLAVMYAKGQGVEQSMLKAAIWAARAAQAGNGSAISNVPLIVSGFPRATVNGNDVNIRSKPTTDSVVLKQSDQGTKVVVLRQRGDWSQVLFPSDYVVGWVANFLLNRGGSVASGTTPSTEPAAQTSGRSNASTNESSQQAASNSGYGKTISGDVANIRQGPSTQSPVLFQAHHGDRLTILKSNQYGWKYVQFRDGRTGWIAGFLLENA